jgi:3',5'-cyclic AMP phosphodiesterase CpdA
MTLHLLPASRRRFLQTTTALGASVLTFAEVRAAESDPNYWALLADTHIAGNENETARGIKMYDHLNRIVDELLAENPRPTGVIINGDCAHRKGHKEDYATLRKPIDRLVNAGLPVHMTMGNHDNRIPFYAAFANQKPETQFVPGKHVTVLPSENANLFLVDSLQIVNNVTGEIGEAQLNWLDAQLEQHSDRPAIIIGHHNPQYLPEGSKAKVTGLADTSKFIDLMHSHSHVQAYFYGHTHDWKLTKTSGHVNLINQPPCAYVFKNERPSGWVRLTLKDDAFSVELRALDRSHPQHEEVHQFESRFAAAK